MFLKLTELKMCFRKSPSREKSFCNAVKKADAYMYSY